MSPTPGSRFGSYEIVSLLGVGGMGEVYRARDTRLKRDVALKFLSAPFAQDAERLARFQREAELLATLSHANIASIYGLEDARDATGPAATALVMELVEGPTLDEHLKAAADSRQKLLLKEIVDIALQIADALEAAHERGVIHRDLKPANIKLTAASQVKVLDFGLAKLAEPAGIGTGPAGLTHSPTLSMQATFAGMILGTAAYMSPEQARGKAVDKRTDIWAFGCVLFEMLAGKRAFDGEDVTDAIASVVAREPDWAALPAEIPSQLTLLLRRCLEKDPRKRIGDIGTARFLMTETIAPAASSAKPVDPTTTGLIAAKARRRTLAFTGIALVTGAVIAAGATWLSMRAPVESPRPVRFSIVPPASVALVLNGADRDIAISPDGTRIVYRGGRDAAQLIVRALDQLDSQLLPGISGIRSPFISPNGQWIGFFGGPNDELRKVSMTGGPPLVLCRYTGVSRGASWGPDGTIVFATNDTSTGLLSVPEGGGDPKVLTKPDAASHEIDHLFPSFLPGGHVVLFTITMAGGAPPSSFGGNVAAQIAALDLRTGRKKILLRGGSSAEYVATGHLVYAAGGTLRAVRFDPERLEVLSDPVPVAEQVMTSGTGAANFTVSRSGTLVYVSGGTAALQGGPQRSLAWVSRQGREEPLKVQPRAYSVPRLSPDGKRLAVDIRDQENDIWIWDFARATLGRLTSDPTADIYPVWTPDGRRIVFGSTRTGLMSLYSRAADGTGTDEPLAPNPNVTTPSSFSPDGKVLTLTQLVPGKNADISVLRMDESGGKRQVEPLISTPFAEADPEISPDGHWIAYYSNESGQQDEVYVRPFPKVDAGKVQISQGGGSRPAWNSNGRELFYLTGSSMMAVPIQTNPSFRAGNPVKLFEGQFYTGQNTRSYDVSADGQRFLMVKGAAATLAEQGSPNMVVVEHWTEEVKARVPAK
jgi:serine/threonine-protein kinase